MQKVLNYILYSYDIGLKVLLPFACVVSLLFTFSLKMIAEDTYIPAIQKATDEIFPLRVEDGVIVEPQNFKKSYLIPLNNIPVQINTAVSDIDTRNLNPGFYISKDKVYTVNRNFTKVHQLKGTYSLPRGNYIQVMQKKVSDTFWKAFLYGYALFTIAFFIVIFIYSLISYIVTAFLGKRFSFDLRMRLSAVAFASTYIVMFFLEMITGYNSYLIFLIAAISFMALVFSELPEKEK